jgi:maltose-binding protein MalE
LQLLHKSPSSTQTSSTGWSVSASTKHTTFAVKLVQDTTQEPTNAAKSTDFKPSTSHAHAQGTLIAPVHVLSAALVQSEINSHHHPSPNSDATNSSTIRLDKDQPTTNRTAEDVAWI